MARQKSELKSILGKSKDVLFTLIEGCEDQGGDGSEVFRINTNRKVRDQIIKLLVSNGEKKFKHVIDLDAAPFIPNGWEVEQHRKRGQLAWDPAKINQLLSDSQKHGRTISGLKLKSQLVRSADGSLYVRYLDWGGGRWRWDYGWLGVGFGGHDPAAVSQV